MTQSSSEPILTGNCVYILKTGKDLFKDPRDLHKRLASYHTHLPVLFRVVRQYAAANMEDLEASLHIVFQHRRVKGEWFRLGNDDLTICDNIARNYALSRLQRQARVHEELPYSSDPLLQVMEANEKYLRDYSRIADDIKLGLSVQEIVELHEGTVSKTTIQTVRRLLNYQTPNRNSSASGSRSSMSSKPAAAKERSFRNITVISTVRRSS